MNRAARLRSMAAALSVFLLSVAGVFAADVYPDHPDAKPEIRQALVKARAEHKRVLLEFGGNWCGDCKVLDLYFQQSPNDELLKKNFVRVPVNIGHYDMNTDVADKYGVPLKKGVPELIVLSASGEVLNPMTTAVFEKMNGVQSSAVTDFLNQWKPKQ